MKHPVRTSQTPVQPSHRPLRWWSEASLASMGRALDAACDEWAAAWQASLAPVQVFNAAEAPFTEGAGIWRAVPLDAANGASTSLWAFEPASAAGGRFAQAALFGGAASAHPGSLAAEFAARAWVDFAQVLTRRLMVETGEALASTLAAYPAQPTARPWSGDVRVRLASRDGVAEVWLHLDHMVIAPSGEAAANRWSGQMPPIRASIDKAVAPQPIRLRAALAETEVDLGTLESLRVGDVLTLAHRLDEPLSLNYAGVDARASDALAFKAYLGARDGRRAVQIASASAPSDA